MVNKKSLSTINACMTKITSWVCQYDNSKLDFDILSRSYQSKNRFFKFYTFHNVPLIKQILMEMRKLIESIDY